MSSAVAGPFATVAALLAVAGLAKVVRPAGTARALRAAGLPAGAAAVRLLGVVEVALAVAAVALGSRPLALVVAAAYLAFAAFTVRLMARSGGTADCGCFGGDEAPASNLHVALDLGAATIAAAAAAAPPGTLASVLSPQPLAGVPFLALVAVATWLGYVAFTLLPDLAAAIGEPDEADDASRTGRRR